MKYFLLTLSLLLATSVGAGTRLVPTSTLPTCGTSSTRLVPCVSGGSMGTDFTEDANALGCWLLFSNDVVGGAEADQCPAGDTDNMTYTGSFAVGGSVPSGTASGQDSVDFDGATEQFLLADQDEFEAANFTVGCWVFPQAEDADVIFGKNDTNDWEILRLANGTFQNEVTNVRETSATSTSENIWMHMVLRYSSTTDQIEVFLDGIDDCSGGCEAQTTAPTGNTNNMVIGADHAVGTLFTGDLMECFYMNRAATNTEICEIVLCGFDGTADGATRDSAFGATGCHCSNIATCC